MSVRYYVQAKGEDGLFRTVDDGVHVNISTAFAHFTLAADEQRAVLQLVRGDHIMLRSDQPVTEPASQDALF